MARYRAVDARHCTASLRMLCVYITSGKGKYLREGKRTASGTPPRLRASTPLFIYFLYDEKAPPSVQETISCHVLDHKDRYRIDTARSHYFAFYNALMVLRLLRFVCSFSLFLLQSCAFSLPSSSACPDLQRRQHHHSSPQG